MGHGVQSDSGIVVGWVRAAMIDGSICRLVWGDFEASGDRGGQWALFNAGRLPRTCSAAMGIRVLGGGCGRRLRATGGPFPLRGPIGECRVTGVDLDQQADC